MAVMDVIGVAVVFRLSTSLSWSHHRLRGDVDVGMGDITEVVVAIVGVDVEVVERQRTASPQWWQWIVVAVIVNFVMAIEVASFAVVFVECVVGSEDRGLCS